MFYIHAALAAKSPARQGLFTLGLDFTNFWIPSRNCECSSIVLIDVAHLSGRGQFLCYVDVIPEKIKILLLKRTTNGDAVKSLLIKSLKGGIPVISGVLRWNAK